MILNDTVSAIESSRRDDFYYPRYEDYCLSNIPRAVTQILSHTTPVSPLEKLIDNACGAQKFEKVIVLLVDGFGFEQWKRYVPHIEFLKTVESRGSIAPITTVFPSTTAAALTTIESGLTPQEHGLLEWWIYFEEIDETIISLRFNRKDEKHMDTMIAAGTDPKILFNDTTLYEKLKAAGISSFKFVKQETVHSAYTNLMQSGAKIFGYTSPSELFLELKTKLATTNGPAYFFVYYDLIDTTAHKHGPHSEEYLTVLKTFSEEWQKKFFESLTAEMKQKTLLLITADHGQIAQPKEKSLDLVDYPEVTDLLAVNKKRVPILPWGSPRDLYFKAKPGKIDELKETLFSILGDRVLICNPDELMNTGLYGTNTPHPQWEKRLGDIVVLAKDEYTVWYEPRVKLGGHGGLTKGEMLIPLGILPLENV